MANRVFESSRNKILWPNATSLIEMLHEYSYKEDIPPIYNNKRMSITLSRFKKLNLHESRGGSMIWSLWVPTTTSSKYKVIIEFIIKILIGI